MSQALSSSFASRLLANHLLSEEQLRRAVAVAGEDDQKLADHLMREGLLTRFQARQLRAGSVSLSVGNYVVVDFIGRGGSGIVLKACHRLMPGRYVALKTMEMRSLHASTDMLARFRQEIQIVSQLDHPNVVRALDVIETRRQIFLVLEYVSGRDLGKLVADKGPLPVAEAVQYIIHAARGLSYAHQKGIVHRDLKPTNLLLTEEKVVKIADMGLARFFANQTSTDLTAKGLAIGTPEYMAPEQAEDATSADPRSDLYSLGATLFHLLTGTPSVEGSSYFHKLQRLLAAPPRPLAEVRPDMPARLAQAVDQLRARRPEDRPQSAEEAIAWLEPFSPAETPPAVTKPDPRQVADAVLRVLRGQEPVASAVAALGLTATELEEYQRLFIEGGRRALDPNQPSDSDESAQRLHAKIGAQQMEIEELKRKLNSSGTPYAIPLGPRQRDAVTPRT